MGLHLPLLEVSPGLYRSGPDQVNIRMEPVDNRHLDSNSSFLICSSLHLGAPGFLGMVCLSLSGVFLHSHCSPPFPYLEVEGFSIQVPSLIFLSFMSLLLCAPESLLACSPIVEMPAANFSSSDEAVDGFGSKTSS